MKNTAIVAIAEPLSFSLDNSLSWSLTRALRQKNAFNLTSSAGTSVAMVGMVPILQPMRATLPGGEAFVVVTRCMFEASDVLTVTPGNQYSLVDTHGKTTGKVFANSDGKHAVMSLLLLSPEFAQRKSSEFAVLQSYLADMSAHLWNSEPINWTTHALHLASTGQFLSGSEIAAQGLKTGVLNATGSTVAISSGTKASRVPYKRWRGAGQVTNIAAGDASTSYCTCGGGSSSGGDFGTGADSIGGGGFSGGNSFAAGGGSAGGGGDPGGGPGGCCGSGSFSDGSG